MIVVTATKYEYDMLDRKHAVGEVRFHSSWIDDIECLVRVAHEAAFSKRGIRSLYSEAWDVSIVWRGDDWTTTSKEVKDEALRQGYWVEQMNFDKWWVIYFTWSKDPNKSPNNRAKHRGYR